MGEKIEKPTTNGRFELIDKNDLKIDIYQRREVPKTISRIAQNFQWELFGALSVADRSNSGKYILDGQQRWQAAMRRDDIIYLPCVVHSGNNTMEEAAIFTDINSHRTPVKAVDKFKANVIAGRSPDKEIDNWLNQHGWRVLGSSRDTDTVTFVHSLVRTWKVNPDVSKEVLLMQRDINTFGNNDRRDPMNVAIHMGLFYIMTSTDEYRNPLVAPFTKQNWVSRLGSGGGQPAMLKAIKQVQIELSIENTARISALGILRVFNYKCRNKIVLPEKRYFKGI